MKSALSSGMRKKKYISHQIQGSLLIALIAFEVLLISLAILYLYFRFDAIMDEQIYSIHRKQEHTTLIVLFMELIKIIAILTLINILALFLVHLFWDYYIKNVLHRFRNELNNINSLDFRTTQNQSKKLHEVLGLIQHWKILEQERCEKLTQLCKQLENQLDSGVSEQEITQTARKISKMLP